MLTISLILFYCIFTNLNGSMRHYILFILALFFGSNSIASINAVGGKTTVDFNRNKASILFCYRDSCLINVVSSHEFNCCNTVELILREGELDVNISMKDVSPRVCLQGIYKISYSNKSALI